MGDDLTEIEKAVAELLIQVSMLTDGFSSTRRVRVSLRAISDALTDIDSRLKRLEQLAEAGGKGGA